MICRMVTVLTSPACVTNCAEQSKPTNKNSRNGDMVSAMDLVRASSRSPSCFESRVDECVGCRDKSVVDELNDDGDSDNSSFGSREPFVLSMAIVSLSQSQASVVAEDLDVASLTFARYSSTRIDSGAKAIFRNVEDMGLC